MLFRSLLDACTTRDLVADETLIDPAATNGHLYLVLEGRLHVYLDGPELPAHTELVTGDCAGEMSIIDGQVPSARVVAVAPTRVLVIDHDILWSLVDHSHGIARNLLAILAGRVRAGNKALVASQCRSLAFEQAASVDALTGLHNRRWMMESFPRAIHRCRMDGQPLCLVMADIDYFKQFNDRHGHLVGDAVLRRVAAQLAGSLRPQDLVARYGGEEFAVLLPQTELADAIDIAERLRAAVAEAGGNTPTGTEAGVTLSCGVARLTANGDFETLLAAADRALYQAKAAGRNRVEANRDK